MRDAVALAYSGRIPEAREAAFEQVSSDDGFLVGQGLEALAALGQQYGVRSDARIDALLAECAASEEFSIARRAFDAAASLQSRAVEDVAARRLSSGDASWDVLRYVGELPSLALGRALAQGWDAISDRIRDEALLTCRVVPVADSDENDAWGRRALGHVAERSDEIRLAAFRALWCWRPVAAADACARALEDDVQDVREAAALALAVIDVDRLVARLVQLEEEFPEVTRALPPEAASKLAEARLQRG